MRVKVLEIPGELDPDEYIQQNGADAIVSCWTMPLRIFTAGDRVRNKFDMGTVKDEWMPLSFCGQRSSKFPTA